MKKPEVISGAASLVSHNTREMPDIASDSPGVSSHTIDQVGMTDIEFPVLLASEDGGPAFRSPARIDAFVSVDDPSAKGIHMSRLYLLTQNELCEKNLSFETLNDLLGKYLESHQDMSQSAWIKVRFEYLCERPALKSENFGWRNYPVTFYSRSINGTVENFLEFKVLYSSTCPCSAALARQLIQENFQKSFSRRKNDLKMNEVLEWLGQDKGILATPHSQRSEATVQVQLKPGSQFSIVEFIDLIEEQLQTPVQAAVKREDEQEFALKNGQNLMFCEDAARKMALGLDQKTNVLDYWAEANHGESLHPHNAVSRITKKNPEINGTSSLPFRNH